MNYPHGGDIYGDNRIRLDFSVNTNPLGMPESIKRAVRDSAISWERYPDPFQRELKRAASAYYAGENCPFLPDAFLFGNGASDLLYSLVFAVRPRRALVTAPAFSEYEKAFAAVGAEVQYLFLKPETGFSLEAEEEEFFRCLEAKDAPEMVVITNPSNPNGSVITAEWLEKLADCCSRRGILLVLDECFHWFTEEWQQVSLLPAMSQTPEKYTHVVVLNALTKIFSMAGLRLGFLVCVNPELREKIEGMRQPWSVSAPAEAAGLAAFREREFIRNTAAYVQKERQSLAQQLERTGFTVYPSSANYLLFRKAEQDGTDYGEACLQRGILIRRCGNYAGLDENYYRVAVRTGVENQRLIEALLASRELVEENERWQRQL